MQSLRDEGKHLPRELVDWFEWFGYIETPTAPWNGRLAPVLQCLTLEAAIKQTQWWQEHSDLFGEDLTRDWLPIAHYKHGASIVVNCTPELGDGDLATVAYFSELGELTAKSRWLPSLATLLSWWTEQIRSGGWTFDPEQGWDIHVDPRTDLERYATGLM